ncbi:MAG: poly-gamma-glutamate system protein [Deltaproteobacteria bacterium]|nr:poly-gamma-glutamate system protein [Deltaproteobacteria bacterium]
MLAILAVSALATIVLLESIRWYQPDPRQREKEAAMELMQRAVQTIKTEKLRMGIPIDRHLDPNETGLIGVEYNDITTTRGSLIAKRTSTNTAFAAVVVEMLDRAGVGPGDPIAACFSGSFPALNIAVLSATKVLNLQPAIISSEGASMYGANQPEMTWLDMERILFEKGLLPYRSIAASLGGIADARGGLDGTGIDAGLMAIRRNGIPLIEEGGEPSLAADIRRRLALFDQALGGQRPAAFINVGGSLTSAGSGPGVNRLPTGLLEKVPVLHNPERGIIFRMGERGVPVIHLLKIRSIAAQYGIPIDPPSLPAGPPGKTMKTGRYSIPIAVASLALLIFLLVVLKKPEPRRTASGGA